MDVLKKSDPSTPNYTPRRRGNVNTKRTSHRYQPNCPIDCFNPPPARSLDEHPPTSHVHTSRRQRAGVSPATVIGPQQRQYNPHPQTHAEAPPKSNATPQRRGIITRYQARIRQAEFTTFTSMKTTGSNGLPPLSPEWRSAGPGVKTLTRSSSANHTTLTRLKVTQHNQPRHPTPECEASKRPPHHNPRLKMTGPPFPPLQTKRTSFLWQQRPPQLQSSPTPQAPTRLNMPRPPRKLPHEHHTPHPPDPHERCQTAASSGLKGCPLQMTVAHTKQRNSNERDPQQHTPTGPPSTSLTPTHTPQSPPPAPIRCAARSRA